MQRCGFIRDHRYACRICSSSTNARYALLIVGPVGRIHALLDAFHHALGLVLNFGVEGHQNDVTSVRNDHYHCLPPEDGLVNENKCQDNDSNAVNEAVACNWIPIQRDFLASKKATDGDDAEDVEDGASNDGPNAQV